MTELTIGLLKNEAKNISVIESTHDEASIFGSTDNGGCNTAVLLKKRETYRGLIN